MRLTKRQLRKIIKQEKAKILKEHGRTSHGNTPVESFPDDMGYVEMVEEVHYICNQMTDGSVRLMNTEDYVRMLSFMYDAAEDGDKDIQEFLDMLTARQQGQYVRIALR